MIILTFEEIARLRSELATDSMAMECLDLIEDCDGNVEDAAISLALRSGLEPDTSDRWLESLAKRYRATLCQRDMRETLLEGNAATLNDYLTAAGICPPPLVAPVVIFVLSQGLSSFCHSFDSNRTFGLADPTDADAKD